MKYFGLFFKVIRQQAKGFFHGTLDAFPSSEKHHTQRNSYGKEPVV